MSKQLFSMGLGRDILAILTRNGYQTQQDIVSNFADAEALGKELKVSLHEANRLFSMCQLPSTPTLALQTTQSAAQMVLKSEKISTGSSPLNRLLDGGIPRGHMLEVSGPPGSPKQNLATTIVSSVVQTGREVIFLECRNNTSPADLIRSLNRVLDNPRDHSKLVHYSKVHALADLILFLHQLPSFFESHPNISLLVISSISSPLQDSELTPLQRSQIFEKIKQAFLKMSSSQNITIVLTSQLATKMVNADGTPGTFDSGAKGIMLPQLGPAYLPSGKSHRVILAITGLGTGVMKLLSSPKYPPGKVPSISAPYEIVDGNVV